MIKRFYNTASKYYAIARHGWIFSLFTLFIFGLVVYGVSQANGPDRFFRQIADGQLYSRYIDPIIAIATFMLALFIGIQNISRSWKDSLEKRLSVCFLYNYSESQQDLLSLEELQHKKAAFEKEISLLQHHIEKLAIAPATDESSFLNYLREKKSLEQQIQNLKKEQAPYLKALLHQQLQLQPNQRYPMIIYFNSTLGHRGDIRGWAQQLGAQADGDRRLQFLPYQHYGKEEEIQIQEGPHKKFVKHYVFGYYLKSIPQIVRQQKQTLLFDDNHEYSPANAQHLCPLRPIQFAHQLTRQHLEDRRGEGGD